KRFCATARHGDDTRLGRGVVNLHLARPQRRNRRQQDNPTEAPLQHLVLDGENDQVRASQIHVDHLAPDVVRKLGVVLDIADRAAWHEKMSCSSLAPVLATKPANVTRFSRVAGNAWGAAPGGANGRDISLGAARTAGITNSNTAPFTSQPRRRPPANAARTAS